MFFIFFFFSKKKKHNKIMSEEEKKREKKREKKILRNIRDIISPYADQIMDEDHKNRVNFTTEMMCDHLEAIFLYKNYGNYDQLTSYIERRLNYCDEAQQYVNKKQQLNHKINFKSKTEDHKSQIGIIISAAYYLIEDKTPASCLERLKTFEEKNK
jgi:hypothetical protein